MKLSVVFFSPIATDLEAGCQEHQQHKFYKIVHLLVKLGKEKHSC